MSANKFYLTTPIYYVNARPHIGHAYSTIVADVLARRHRLLGDETYFLTGTDEHGQKIERSAAAAGIPPQQFTDQVSKTFSDLWARMGITHNQFIRTTSESHKRGVQKLFRTLYENGHIYLASYTGSYCVSDEAFLDAPVGTPCPDCGRLLEEVTEENFFFKLSEFQLPLLNLIESGDLFITPRASNTEVLTFLRGPWLNVVADAYEQAEAPDSEQTVEKMLEWALKMDVIRQSKAGNYYVPGALKDLSISRSSFTWGIPVPPDIQAKEKTKQPHVIYVWLDALANYMTALGYGSDDTTLFDKFWPADLHLVGKEITRFHCVYWPAFLLALNPNPGAPGLDSETWAAKMLPKQITANGWLLFDNAKMSKSKGNIVRTETILDAFGTLCPPPPAAPLPSDSTASSSLPLDSTGLQSGESEAKQGGALAPGTPLPTEPTKSDRDLFAADILRYYLLREIPFGQDGSFSFESLITRYNADLANGYGNLVSRTLSMIEKYFGGVIEPSTYSSYVVSESLLQKTEIFDRFVNGNPSGVWLTDIPSEAVALSLAVDSNLQRFHFIWVLQACSELIRMLDSEITSRAPWKAIVGLSDEEMKQKRSDILYLAAESIRIITALLYPILPYATARVWAQLGLGDIEAAAANGELKNLHWGGLQPGTKLGPLGPIFPRAPKELAQIMTDMENPTPVPATTAPDAGPRTASLDEPTGTLPVAGSHAHTTGPDPSLPKGEPAPHLESPSLESPQITIDDFAKIDLRVAQITLAERIPKADKLLRLEVDLGPLGTRQILSGIAEHYTPEELTGRRIVVIANLAPRKMRGLESHGMLLAASEGDHGKPHLATCGDDIALGSRLK